MQTTETLARVGIDAVACKPTEVDCRRATALSVDAVTIDYEGRSHVPDRATLSALAEETMVRVTTPVRADGFDPLGDDSVLRTLPSGVRRVLVAGHDAYLTDEEARRAVAPRLRRAAERASDPWVGTAGIERLALAVGRTQFELLSRTTERDVRALRAAGFEGELAVYAPTVLTADEEAILDAVGEYVARRGPVREVLPDDAATDAAARGEARAILSQAAREYALVGDVEAVTDRVDRLKEIGVDHVVAYPARGLESFLDER